MKFDETTLPGEGGALDIKKIRAALLVVMGKDFGKEFWLEKNETRIGRDVENEIHLSDGLCSRHHVKIVVCGTTAEENLPQYKIIDLGSKNRLFLNNELTSEGLLKDGDKVRIGDTTLKFMYKDLIDIEYDVKMHRLATRDSLTGLYNRNYFCQELNREFHRAERYGHPFALLMLDIDDFKLVNDTYGHPVGDVVLSQIGMLIQDATRQEDTAGRYGGEEFIVLLPETDAANATQLGERLKGLVAAMEFNYSDKKFRVTVSVGVSAYSEDMDKIEDIIMQADKALYMAKNSGKNKLFLYRHP